MTSGQEIGWPSLWKTRSLMMASSAVQDGGVRLEDLVDESELGLGQLAGDDPGESVLLQGLEGDGTEELFRRGELGEQALEVAAAEGLGDGTGQRGLGGARGTEEQDVLPGEYSSQGAVDDVAAFGESGGEFGAELRDGVDGHGSLVHAGSATRYAGRATAGVWVGIASGRAYVGAEGYS